MLEEKIKELARQRALFEIAKGQYELRRKEFEGLPEVTSFKSSAEALEKLETAIRQEAEKIFTETGEKNPHPAVEVKEKIELLVDEPQALKYAYENLTDALALDHKIFGKVMRALPLEKVPACVTILQVPKAYIRKDLSEFLKEISVI